AGARAAAPARRLPVLPGGPAGAPAVQLAQPRGVRDPRWPLLAHHAERHAERGRHDAGSLARRPPAARRHRRPPAQPRHHAAPRRKGGRTGGRGVYHHAEGGGATMMGWPTQWWDEVGNQLWGMLDAFRGEARRQGMLALPRPIAPFTRPEILPPAVTIA